MKFQKVFSAILAVCIAAGSCIAHVSAEDYVTPTPVQLQFGDLNMDTAVDVADAVAVARYCVMDYDLKLSDQGKLQGDVNADGNLDEKDLQKILRYIARQIEPGALGQPDPKVEHKYNAVNLMEGITAKTADSKQVDEVFLASQMKLAVDLFKGAAQDPESADKDLLVSPLSVSQAIAMATNGAKGQTREEMEKLLGDTLDIDALNQYYYDYTSHLASTDKAKLHLANSLWIRNDEGRIQVPEAFLQTTNDYYGADAYKAPFDDSTVEDVNSWVNENTFEMIPEIVKEIHPGWVMMLINALAFDAEWASAYSQYEVSDATFHAYDRDMTVEMMHSKERAYLEDEYATGFIKEYAGGDYSFAAILPKEEKSVTVSDYIGMMTSESLQKLLSSKTDIKVNAGIPKFKYGYSLKMNDMLQALGMKTAFSDSADFTGLNALGGSYIDAVLHKTFIQVDEKGTKAGAVTFIGVEATCVEDSRTVSLNRPFIYMILDNKTNLPVFMGYVLHPTEVVE